MTSQRGRGMDKENEHFGYRNVSWVQSSSVLQPIKAGFWAGAANPCPSVFPWHKDVMGCSSAGAWWPSIALLLTEQICVTTNRKS